MQAQVIPDDSFAGWVSSLYVHAPSIKAAAYAAIIGVPFYDDAKSLVWNGPLWTMRTELFYSVELFAIYFVFGKHRVLAFIAYSVTFGIGNIVYYMLFILGASLNGAVPWLRRHQNVSLAFFRGWNGAWFGELYSIL